MREERGCCEGIEVMKNRSMALIRFQATGEEEAHKVAAWWWGLSRCLKLEVPAEPPTVEELKTNEYLKEWQALGLPRFIELQRSAYTNKPPRTLAGGSKQGRVSLPSLESSF